MQKPQSIRLGILTISLGLLVTPMVALAHGGHGDEFKGSGDTGHSSAIEVDPATVKSLDIKVETVRSQLLGTGFKATGQIEALPSQKVEVTAPVKGKIVTLLVNPGATVKAGQTLAIMSSSELVDLRVTSQEKTAESQANLQQAQTDLQLAQANYGKYQQITAAEIQQAQRQLDSAKAQLGRDQQLVNRRGVVQVAQANYQQQQQISRAEIVQSQAEVKLAQERLDQDRQLFASGALPRRQMLESQSKLAAAQVQLVRSQRRPEVIQAATEIQKAEVDLPLRQLQESNSKVAEAQTALTKALARRDLVAAEAQLKRSQAAVTAAQAKLNLSSTSYKTRLQQLGTQADAQGLIRIVAPIGGVVADREITPGQSVADSGAKLMTIVNDAQVIATANIYEKDLSKIQVGQEVKVKVAGLEQELFTGIIDRIGTVVSDSRVVPVQAQLSNLNGQLRPGMFAELEMVTGRTSSPVLAIPSSAVVEANGQKLVYIQQGNSFLPTEVTLGESSGELVRVTKGLFAGDKIVIQRAAQLYAQSLRGGAKTTGNSHQQEGQTAQGFNLSTLPLWLIGAGVGISGALLGGGWWLRRRSLHSGELVEDTAESPISDSAAENIDRPVEDHRELAERSSIAPMNPHQDN
jgi:membrane fusion protein, heavy metal efflux system